MIFRPVAASALPQRGIICGVFAAGVIRDSAPLRGVRRLGQPQGAQALGVGAKGEKLGPVLARGSPGFLGPRLLLELRLGPVMDLLRLGGQCRLLGILASISARVICLRSSAHSGIAARTAWRRGLPGPSDFIESTRCDGLPGCLAIAVAISPR